MPAASQDKAVRIHIHDVFAGVFAMVQMRGYDGLHPERSTRDHHNAYDAACIAVYERVSELCDQRGDDCRFVMVAHHTYGYSERAREVLAFQLSLRVMHTRMPGDGFHFFTNDAGFAEHRLKNAMKQTGYSREIFEELAEIFMRIYIG